MIPQIETSHNGKLTKVVLNSVTYWFSYQTVIAFATKGERFVRENDWGPTTGRHLNSIDDGVKKGRLPGDEFESMLKEL